MKISIEMIAMQYNDPSILIAILTILIFEKRLRKLQFN